MIGGNNWLESFGLENLWTLIQRSDFEHYTVQATPAHFGLAHKTYCRGFDWNSRARGRGGDSKGRGVLGGFCYGHSSRAAGGVRGVVLWPQQQSGRGC